MHFSSFLLLSLAGLSIAAPRPAAGNLDRREPLLGGLLSSLLGAKRDISAMEYPVDRMTAKDREGMTALLQSQLDQVEQGSDPEYERTTSPEKKEADKAALKDRIAQLQTV
ncbi:hypothetical protein BDV39DRAFT_182749 [Aspergillus sergii]|uniref:Uncharacterized protein n=1 Tax=Aspergillus sergii TaxID=1034303 RepID=A0A5N6WRD7_9EURO|nr:hypothetical protein BDV39DRAFT_182749 [Aspergillus sergii]